MPTAEAQFSSIIKPDEEALGAAMFQIMELSSSSSPATCCAPKCSAWLKPSCALMLFNVPPWATKPISGDHSQPEANETELVSSSIETNGLFELGEDGSSNLLDKRNGERHLGSISL